MNVKTIAIYVRVSTEEQVDEGFSIQAQLETLRAYARLHQYIIFDEYVDEGISGKLIENRPELNRLLADAKKGQFDEAMVWKVNRISRSMADLLYISGKLEEHGVAFKSFSEPFDTGNAAGKFLMQMMGAVAELERNTIVDNVKLGMRQRAKQGKWNGGQTIGYASIEIEGSTNRKRKETRLEIVESEAAVVRLIFHKYAEGKGFKSITNDLNYMGYKTKMGSPFSITTVKGILSNPLYIGKVRFNKQQDWNTKRRKGTNPDPIIVDGQHAAIISQELWDKVQARYANANKHPARVYYGSLPFTGVMRCPQCGHGMVAQRATRKSKKTGEVKYTPYYQCGQFTNKGSSVCRANSVRADYTEREIMNRVQRLLENPKLINDLTASMNGKRAINKKPLEQELQRLERELTDTNRIKDKYYKLYEEDVLEPIDLKVKINGLSETRLRLEQRHAVIQKQLIMENTSPVSAEMVRGLLASFNTIFGKISHENRKQLVHTLIKEISVTQDRKINRIILRVGMSNTLASL
ncbi:recombinase family protein [Paenibacillus sp. FSL H8-0537]|uniref:recombinase family protein n=1 Tax=Paenibacillus sp. FSL H8-0537 TaxID=2921399 RepID=UPI003100D822